jgi:hypothetical protein
MNWKQAEERVRRATGGYSPSGSGSKFKQGDVRVGDEWILEVKHTDHPYIDIKKTWLDVLEKYCTTHSLVLVVFVGDQGFPYFEEAYGMVKPPDWDSWSTARARPEAMPGLLFGTKRLWRLHPFDELLSIRRDYE